MAGFDVTLAFDNTTADGDPIDPNAGANPNIVGSAYTNNFAGAGATRFTASTQDSTSWLRRTHPTPGRSTPSAPSALTLMTLAAYDVSGLTGIAYAVLQPVGTQLISSLYTVNLTLIGAAIGIVNRIPC